MFSTNSLEKRLQISGVCLVIGLLIEALCLIWGRPISFVIFVSLGGLLIFIGIALYLYSLVSTPRVPD